MSSLRDALWSMAAGALIPLMGVLNARLGRTMGEPLHAPVILFLVALTASIAVALMFTGRSPDFSRLVDAAPLDFAGGLIVAFYVISVTVLAPRFGIANVILFAMVAQIVCSSFINHLGLFNSMIKPVDLTQAFGISLLLIGLVITQLGHSKG